MQPVCRAYAASASASGCGGMSAASLAGDCARLAAAPSSATSAHEQRTLLTTHPHRRCRNAVLPTVGNPSVAIVGRDDALVLGIKAYTRRCPGAFSVFLPASPGSIECLNTRIRVDVVSTVTSSKVRRNARNVSVSSAANTPLITSVLRVSETRFRSALRRTD